MHEYANRPFNDDPLLAYSNCSTTDPQQTGMWMLDQSSGEEYRVTSWAYNITRCPQEIADDYFEGKSMVFGPGKSTGTRGSSAGPSVGVRPWTVPTTEADNFTPLLYYWHDGYPVWPETTKFQGASDSGANVGICSRTPGGEFFRIDSQEAYVTIGQRPVVHHESYPASEWETAGPTDPAYVGQTYIGNPDWPDPREVPVQWYGIEECNETSAYGQQPAYTDGLPKDCNMVKTCYGGTGPGCHYIKTFMYLYSMKDLADAYNGQVDPETIQPYYELEVTVDVNSNGIHDLSETCAQPSTWNGVTADHVNNLFLFSHPASTAADTSGPPYGTDKNRAISVYSLGNASSIPTDLGIYSRTRYVRITASPNPFNARTTISVSGFKKDVDVAIIDLNGKVVFSVNQFNGRSLEWNAENYPSGLYVAQVKMAGRYYRTPITLIK
jgi:hypothetical protein